MAKQYASLLDTLFESSGCAYMSDLTQSLQAHAISVAVKELSLKNYEDEEWIKTAEYISQEKMSFSSAAAARNYLIRLK